MGRNVDNAEYADMRICGCGYLYQGGEDRP